MKNEKDVCMYEKEEKKNIMKMKGKEKNNPCSKRVSKLCVDVSAASVLIFTPPLSLPQFSCSFF